MKRLCIRARLYAALSCRPSYVKVETQESGSERFPLLEGTIAGLRTQPFIHDCPVTVFEKGATHTFRVFCKNHCLLPANKVVEVVAPGLGWKGDVVVLRVGKKHTVVNMRGRDAGLADFVVQR